jgi:hypothetical protein
MTHLVLLGHLLVLVVVVVLLLLLSHTAVQCPIQPCVGAPHPPLAPASPMSITYAPSCLLLLPEGADQAWLTGLVPL